VGKIKCDSAKVALRIDFFANKLANMYSTVYNYLAKVMDKQVTFSTEKLSTASFD
jgi:hypothetical protein